MKKTLPLLLVALAGCSEPPAGESTSMTGDEADLVFTNARVYTVDADRSEAEAVAIDGGRIVYVGSDAGAEPYIGEATTVVDLDRKLLLPAFQDAHIHPISGGIEVLACDLAGEADLAGYRAAIAACAETAGDKPWITGGGWSMAAFGPGARADRRILDELVPGRPAFMTSADGHTAWVNSSALEIAGIDSETPDPPGGVIDRDPETGEPVGSLQETAIDLVARHVPEATREERVAGLEYARDLLHGYGITALQSGYTDPDDLPVIVALDEAGQLDLRFSANILWNADADFEQIDEILELRDRFTTGNLRTGGVKIFQDGVMENYTAAMLEPYRTEEGGRGKPRFEPAWLAEIVKRLDAAGLQVHIHAIGDAAIRQALDAFEAARAANGPSDLRHHIAHLQIIHPDDIPRFGELGVVANFQPLWAYADEYVTELTWPFIGEEEARWMYPIRSVWDAGGTVAFGSDWSVSTPDPFAQIETAVTRVDAINHDTPVMNPEQRISVEQAIAAFTINSAYVNHLDATTGSIEVGKFADLIVLDRDLFAIDPEEISDTKVLLTLFEGEAVHGTLAGL
jgi:predicted amidohydrolase YtcJ